MQKASRPHMMFVSKTRTALQRVSSSAWLSHFMHDSASVTQLVWLS